MPRRRSMRPSSSPSPHRSTPRLADALLDRAFARRPTSLVLVEARELPPRRGSPARDPALLRLQAGGRTRRDPSARRRSRRQAERLRGGWPRPVARTISLSAGLGVLVAWNWARLEQPRPSFGPLALMVLLGIAPALLPSQRWRLAGWPSQRCSSPHRRARRVRGPGRSEGSRAAPATRVPRLLRRARPVRRRGASAACTPWSCSPSSSSRRSARWPSPPAGRSPQAIVLVAGAGWPATILPGTTTSRAAHSLLVAALALVAWLRPEEPARPAADPRRDRRSSSLALIASSSGAVAKSQFLNWQDWDLYDEAREARERRVRLAVELQRHPLPEEADARLHGSRARRSVYWRATTLDAFAGRPAGTKTCSRPTRHVLAEPRRSLDRIRCCPPRAHDTQRTGARADVTIDALRDTHLVGPSAARPVRHRRSRCSPVPAGRCALALRPVPRGAEYTVWGYTPQPARRGSRASPADYPPRSRSTALPRPQHSRAVPPFGTPEHAAWARDYFEDDVRRRALSAALRRAPSGSPARPRTRTRRRWRSRRGSARAAGSPTTRPRRASRGAPPLVQFVTRTKRGYCQHFAGAMALMLRYLGIPARVAAGFTSGTYDEEAGTWTSTTARRTPGSRSGSRATAGSPSTRPRAAARSAGRTRPPRLVRRARAAKVLTASALAGRAPSLPARPPARRRARRARAERDAAGDRAGAGGDRNGGVGAALIVALVALIGVPSSWWSASWSFAEAGS